MANFTFFFNPMSRAQIARWALHEVGADYAAVMVDWANKPGALLAANPMGKLPTIIHHGDDGDHVVSETAAICHYLAEVAAPELLPKSHEKADYFRWLFFAAGPMEAAVTNKAFGWEPNERQQISAGFGTFDKVIETLDGWLCNHDHVCGQRFTMADVYVGSQILWGLQFKTIPDRESFLGYQARMQARQAYQAAREIDMELIAAAQK